jgi:outer membrane biosynthesis protein TonB
VPVPERSLAPGILTPLVTYSPVFEEGRIYSTADAQVTLPRNVYPKLPPEPPGLDRTTRTVVELTIDTDGLVERVRLLSPPRDVHEFMLLSAAKAWRFDPATLGGRPVRFRHTLVISAIP